MSRSLVTYDDVTHTFESLDPGKATAIGLPAWNVVNALPAAGQVAGEAYLVTATKTGFVWTGSAFVPIVPSALLNYPNDAAVIADKTQQPGSYAASTSTGNLFVSIAGGGWRQIGIRIYATQAALLADTTATDGTIGYASDNFLHFNFVNGAWRPMSILSTLTESGLLSVVTSGNVVGQMAIPQDTARLFIWDGTNWIGQPFRSFDTEAHLLAGTAPDGVLAVAQDTHKVYMRVSGAWQGLAGPTMTSGTTAPTTAATGDMFWNITENKLYVRGSTAWTKVGGGVQVVADSAHLPAATSVKQGDIFWDANKNMPLVCETDGVAPVPLITTSVSPGKNRLVLVDPNGRLIEHYPFPTPSASDPGKTLQIDSTQNWALVAGIPKLAAKLAIAHHMYSANSWELSRHNISDITRYVPIGHMFKLEIVGSSVCYHGNSLEVRSTITGWGGNTSLYRAPNDPDNPGGKTLYHAVSYVSAANMAPQIAIQSWTNVSNGDRAVQGYIFLWDLGLPANILDFT